MDLSRKVSFLVFVLCVLISLRYQTAETNNDKKVPLFPKESCCSSVSLGEEKLLEDDNSVEEGLRYDFYIESCPLAEKIIRSTVEELYRNQPDSAPAILRLVFHDCFVQGCDASVLLETDSVQEIQTEKDALPNKSLRGFDVIDTVKSKLEETCPGVVSCADIVVLAARESVLEAGGPFYPLYTGRRDSTTASVRDAENLPSPLDDLTKVLESFASKGFDERETVSLLGAHSTGTIHCSFFNIRLDRFNETGGPDPSIDPQFLETLRSTCNSSHLSSHKSDSPSAPPSQSSSARSLSESPSSHDPVMKMDYEGPGKDFGTLYYRSLMQNRGLLLSDQQLTASKKTNEWVEAYASNVALFQRDFGRAMIKLSNLQVLTAPKGQVRLSCGKVN